MSKKKLKVLDKRLVNLQEYDKFLDELNKIDNSWYKEMQKMLNNSMLYGTGIFYLEPDELLYGEKNLKVVKKSRLGKLIG